MINPVKISCVELLLEIRKWKAASKQCSVGALLALLWWDEHSSAQSQLLDSLIKKLVIFFSGYNEEKEKRRASLSLAACLPRTRRQTRRSKVWSTKVRFLEAAHAIMKLLWETQKTKWGVRISTHKITELLGAASKKSILKVFFKMLRILKAIWNFLKLLTYILCGFTKH